MITVLINEKKYLLPEDTTISEVLMKLKPNADIVIFNGFPVTSQTDLNKSLKDGDTLVLIKRGETPTREELEYLMVARHSPKVHEVVKRSCVGIAGLGGLGSTVAIALARLGIGKLVLVDFDIVEPSNLNRQQFFVHHIGMYKTDAMKDILRQINPYVQLIVYPVRITPGNIHVIFQNIDILVEALDSVESKKMIIENFHKHFPNIPLICASGVAGYESSNSIKVRKITPKLYLVGDESTSAQIGIGLMSPRVGISAMMQANTVLRLLMGITEP